MDLLITFLNAQWDINGVPILWREIVGNLFGLVFAYAGMKRVVWAWPIGIAGNVLLLTVFLGGVFNTPQDLDLYGQAGRQVMFMSISLYGWWRWARLRHAAEAAGAVGADEAAFQPRWATGRERMLILGLALGGTVFFAWVFTALGSWGPWADAWIFVGSALATWGMARGWTEFWLIWIAVDIVGVPLLWSGGYYPSAVLYLVYGVFVTYGFFTWARMQKNNDTPSSESDRASDGSPAHAKV